MKKKITVVGYSIESINSICGQLNSIFKEDVNIKKITVNDLKKEDNIFSDLILLPTYSLYNQIKYCFDSEDNIVIMSRTISKEGYNKLKSIPFNRDIYIIDETKDMAEEICAVINQLGINHFQINPLVKDDKPKINSILITLQEKDNDDNRIINIGNALLDIDTIIEIGIRLDLYQILSITDLRRAYKEIVTPKIGLSYILNKINSFESQIKVFLDSTDDGIIEFDTEEKIVICNKNALKIIKYKKKEVINSFGKELFPNIPFEKVFKKKEIIKDELVKINNKDVIISVYPMINSGKFYGAVAAVKEFDEVEKKQHEIRKKLISKGHRAKYTFKDIIGNSEVINECKSIAKRMAKSNSSVIITGETGTGKELFAQAIHNASNRRGYQFVAVNCGALPENILESELFGYEEGAFTGARKGGKRGLFEIAHKGTIFLDEISEMPYNIQIKFLRVLQEKEIMRLGSDRIIDIDIRVIAATNKNLEELVENNKFREDLYFRLRVLPLNIPPLRTRLEDILLIIDYYKKEFGGNFKLSSKAKEALFKYNWKGNVRELRNFVEYFVYLGKNVIEIQNIPLMHKDNSDSNITNDIENDIEKFIRFAGKNIDKYIFVLKVLKNSFKNKERVGRRSIHKEAVKNNIFLSEQEIRRILIELDKYFFIRINKGRGGSIITDYGINVLNILEEENNKKLMG